MDNPSDVNPYLSPSSPEMEPAAVGAPLPVEAAIQLPQPHIGWALLTVVGFFAAQIAVAVPVVILFLLVFGSRGLNQEDSFAVLMQWSVIASGLCTCVYAAALIAVVHREAAFRRMALQAPSVWQLALVVMAVLPFAVVVSEITNWLIPYIPMIGVTEAEKLAQMPLGVIIFSMCVCPAIGEELLFRGFIGRGLVGRYGPLAGVLITSVIFGAVHIEPLQAIGAACLGIVLHVIYLTSKSLLVPMILHFLNNLFALLAMRYADVYPLPGISFMGEDGHIVHTPYFVVIAAIALGALLLVLFYQGRSGWRLPDGQPWRFPYVTAELPPSETIQRQSATPNLFLLVVAIAIFGGLIWLLWQTAQQWGGEKLRQLPSIQLDVPISPDVEENNLAIIITYRDGECQRRLKTDASPSTARLANEHGVPPKFSLHFGGG